MFEHENFEVYKFKKVPLYQESYMMDVCYMEEYEQGMVESFSSGEYTNVGYISNIQARHITENSIELSWYPDVFYRFHEVTVSLPKEQFVTCVSCPAYGEKPHIFVKSSWYEHLHLRQYTVFCWIDAIGVRKALESGELNHKKLIQLRDAIDEVAVQYSNVSFVSFADNLILKSNWSVGYFESDVNYTYNPEVFIDVVKVIRKIYHEILGLDIYAILTQGSNEYYEDSLTHISDSENHICLNSFGIPFAQLIAIDNAVSSAIKEDTHKPSELYMDEHFLNSLNFIPGFDKHSFGKYKYEDKMTGSLRNYYCVGWAQLLENLKPKSE